MLRHIFLRQVLSAILLLAIILNLLYPGGRPVQAHPRNADAVVETKSPSTYIGEQPQTQPAGLPPNSPPALPALQRDKPIVGPPVTPGFFGGDLRALPKSGSDGGAIKEMPLKMLPRSKSLTEAQAREREERAVSPVFAPNVGNMPAPNLNFEGLGNSDGVLPPDTVGDVGLNYYIQQVNIDDVAIFEKATGNLVAGPFNLGTLWSDGTMCQIAGNGDPIVVYDPMANRWLISQFAFLNSSFGPFYQCIAISATGGDPVSGGWYTYSFDVTLDGAGLPGEEFFNDYPKFGVWPDAYYMSANQFGTIITFIGGAWAFDRAAMLAGNPAGKQYFAADSFGGLLPSDMDGHTPPPAGAPNYFVSMDDIGGNALRVYEFHVDWVTPANSTLTGPLNLTTDPFDPVICPAFRGRCIHQPDGAPQLETLSDRLMHRLAYRNFGGHQAMVVNHSVDVGGQQAGIRWYELRNAGSGWNIHQQGTYAGDGPDSNHRWMGSIAMDRQGNIALGYSVSGLSTYPSIRYTGRLVGDPPGTLPQGETSIIAGSGSQTHSAARWGDYSAMSVDPIDDCTFWYTQEYIQTTGSASWQTRIASFKFPACTAGPTGSVEGTVIDAVTTNPISNAQVVASYGTVTGGGGFYRFDYLPTGSYTMTVDAYGYAPATAPNVTVVSGTTTVQDFALNPLPLTTISGTVTDATTGWPLYAKIDITAPGGFATTIFNDPVAGTYSIELVEGITHTLTVESLIHGYESESRVIVPPPGSSTENFALNVDSLTCNAPGYSTGPATLLLSEDFDAGIPGAWGVVNNGGDCVWRDDDPGLRGNLTGGSGPFAIADSDYCGDGFTMDTELISPVVDASGYAALIIEYKNDYADLVSTANVDVFDGGTWTTAEAIGGSNSFGPETRVITTTAGAGLANVQVRWHYGAPSWHWWWQVDEVRIYGVGVCAPAAGGLVVGNVYDANTSLALNGAAIGNDSGRQTLSGATPDDANTDDGFYALFSPPGARVFTTSLLSYAPDIQTPTVVQSSTIRQDFSLGSGRLSSSPTSLNVTLELGTSTSRPLTLTNSGGGAAGYEFFELDDGRIILAPGPGGPVQLRSGSYSPLRSGAFSPKESQNHGPDPKRPIPPHAPPWTNIAGYPTAIMDNTAAELDGFIYSVGGLDGFNTLNTGYRYDPGSDSWSAIADMADVRQKPAAAFINDKLYVVGGWGVFGDTLTSLEIYDPATNSWSTGSPVPVGYAAATAVALNGQMYVIGGCSSSCGFTDVYRYDPDSDSWATVAPYPVPVSWNGCGVIRSQIYCAGGTTGSVETASTYVYNLASNSWTQLADLPQPQWGMGYIAVNGLLYISGGVTDNFSTVTNEGFYYDPAGNTWSTLQNSNNAVYRGGSACGFYKIGGSTGGFTPVPDSEVYPGLTDCAVPMDVPWLSEDPISGTVAALTSQPVTITFNAGVPEVDQPGQYFARLRVGNDTPYNIPNAPVTMTVTLPASWGKLEGTVSSLGHCDANPLPLADAAIFLEGTGGMTWTLTSDISGAYKVWLDQTHNPLTAMVSAAGHLPETLTGLVVTAGVTTTQDVDLRLRVPCVTADPDRLEVTVSLGLSRTMPLTVSNIGAGATDFTLSEVDGGVALFGPQRAALHEGGQLHTIAEEKRAGPGGTGPLPSASGGPDGFGYTFKDSAGPDGPVFEWIEIAPPAGGSGVAIGLNGIDDGYFYPLTLPFSFTFYGADYSSLAVATNGTIYFENTYLGFNNIPIPGSNGDGVEAFMAHYWDDLVVDPGEVYYYDAGDRFIIEYYQVRRYSTFGDEGTWQIVLFPTGNILFQYLDTSIGLGYNQGASATVGIQGDTATGLQYSYNALALSDGLAICFAYPGESSDCSTDVPWLSENPETGTLAADNGLQLIDVTFDAGVPEITQTGRYTATLWLNSDDPGNGRTAIPVTMTVSSVGVAVDPAVANRSGDPGETMTYTLRVTNTGLITDTYDLSIAGAGWATTAPLTVGPLLPGAGVDIAVNVTIPASALAGEQDTAVVTFTSQEESLISTTSNLTTQVNADYGVIVTPPNDAQSGLPGTLVAYTLQITNAGNITDTFSVSATGHTWSTVVPLKSGEETSAVVVGPLSPGGDSSLTIAVLVPASATAGEQDTVTVTATSSGHAAVIANSVLTTTASAAGGTSPINSVYVPVVIK